MKFQFLTPTVHGLLDYAAAAGLIVLPFLLGLGATSQLALWLSVAAGIGLVAYSLATDYTFGAVGLFSFRAHLVLDVLAAVRFASVFYDFQSAHDYERFFASIDGAARDTGTSG